MASGPDLAEVQARAFDRTSDLAAVWTPPDGTLVDVNESFLRITGYERDDLIGHDEKELRLWVDPDQRARFLDELDHDRTVTGVTVKLRAKDGTVRNVRGSAELVETSGRLYALAIAKDESEELARREELSRTRRSLRTVLPERRRLISDLDLAVREERARISNDLHDTTLQSLAAAKLRLQMLANDLRSTNRARIAQVEEAIDAAVSTTQALTSELRRPVLEPEDLAASLELALHDQAIRAGLTYHVQDRLSEAPPVDISTLAYEMVREVLTGIELHSQASRVEVELSERDGGLTIAISDDDPGTHNVEGGSPAWRQSAMAPIDRRLRLIGGRLEVRESPGARTTVELWIPPDRGGA